MLNQRLNVFIKGSYLCKISFYLQLDDESIKIFGYLQRLALAFEQVIRDQRSVNSEFVKEFGEAETHLKSVS